MSAWGRRFRIMALWGVTILMSFDGPHGPSTSPSVVLASTFFLFAVIETTVLCMDWASTSYQKQVLPKIDENIHDKWDRVYGTGKYRRTQL